MMPMQVLFLILLENIKRPELFSLALLYHLKKKKKSVM
jgi:hypothetical protein